MRCDAAATVELLAQVAPLPHPVALELAAVRPRDVARNAALLGGPDSPERRELWAAVRAAVHGETLDAGTSERFAYSAPPEHLEAFVADGDTSFDVVAALRGAVRGGRVGEDAPVWELLCDQVAAAAADAGPDAGPGSAAFECGEVAASPLTPPRVRARCLQVATVAHRVGAVLCTPGRAGAATAARIVWPTPGARPPEGFGGYLALHALVRCHVAAAATVAERVAAATGVSTLQRVAVLCALEAWRVAPELTDRIAAEAETLAALGHQRPAPRPAGGSADPAAVMVATVVRPGSEWLAPPAVRVPLERWLAGHPRGHALSSSAAARSLAWAPFVDGRIAAWLVDGCPPGARAEPFGVRWDPDALGAAPSPFAAPPDGFGAAAAELGGSEVAWRFALELADGALSCAELLDLAAATEV